MSRVVVTGGSGKLGPGGGARTGRPRVRRGEPGPGPAGRAALPVHPDRPDRLRPGGWRRSARIDDRYSEVDAVVHLAAIPGPGVAGQRGHLRQQHHGQLPRLRRGPGGRHHQRGLGVQRDAARAAVRPTPPPYLPVDEEYPARPETSYALAKHLEEQMAAQFCRWEPHLKMIGLRFSNVMEPGRLRRLPVVRRRPERCARGTCGLHRRPRRRAGGAAGAASTRRPGWTSSSSPTPTR